MWSEAVQRLREYSTRGLLSAVGVAVGAGAIVFLTSLISSFANESTRGLTRLGHHRIFVTMAPAKPGTAARMPVLTLATADKLRRALPEIAAATPLVALSATVNACGVREPVRVIAAGPDQLPLEDQKVVAGRYIAALDVSRRSGVVVVGHALWRRNECLAQVGSSLQIGSQSYQVIGLLGPKGFRWGESQDEALHLPFSTAEHRYIRPGTPVSLAISVREEADVVATAATVRRLLQRSSSPSAGEIRVSTQTDLLREVQSNSRRLAAITAVILSVAMIIAAIGVMNAVMTSVAERTSEIGLRRAVGATRRMIALQFLLESTVITVGGAVAGIVTGGLAAAAASLLLRMSPHVDGRIALFAFVASLALGLGCGVWPAIRAARLSPVDALRHE